MIDDRRHVERTRLAVDDDLRFADRHVDLGAGLRYTVAVLLAGSYETVAPICSNIERNGIEDRAAAHQRRQDAPLLEDVGIGVDVTVVVENRNLPRGRSAEIRRRRAVCATGVACVSARRDTTCRSGPCAREQSPRERDCHDTMEESPWKYRRQRRAVSNSLAVRRLRTLLTNA